MSSDQSAPVARPPSRECVQPAAAPPAQTAGVAQLAQPQHQPEQRMVGLQRAPCSTASAHCRQPSVSSGCAVSASTATSPAGPGTGQSQSRRAAAHRLRHEQPDRDIFARQPVRPVFHVDPPAPGTTIRLAGTDVLPRRLVAQALAAEQRQRQHRLAQLGRLDRVPLPPHAGNHGADASRHGSAPAVATAADRSGGGSIHRRTSADPPA